MCIQVRLYISARKVDYLTARFTITVDSEGVQVKLEQPRHSFEINGLHFNGLVVGHDD